jgi:peptide deformylase
MKITTNVDYLHKKCKALSYSQSIVIKNKMHRFLLMHKSISSNTLGLACNQLGLEGRVIMYRSNTHKPMKFLINPIILDKSEDIIITKEYCLSVPGEGISIERHKSIVIQEWKQPLSWEYLKPNAAESIVIQHELDHLNGVLISDCRICKIKEAHQFSSMCQSCIDDGWRKNIGIGKHGYYKEQPMPRRLYL